jgi:hypothetical protein
MFGNDPQLWIFGADNYFSRVGLSPCAVSWLESLMIFCTVVIFLEIFVVLAYFMSRWIEWLYLKIRTM